MDFPEEAPTTIKPENVPSDLLPSLGLTQDQVVEVSKNKWDFFVEVRETGQVQALSPDFQRLATVPNSRCVIVTTKADHFGNEPVDFISRVFAPAVGVSEDPVTGSAHCGLAPYWSQRLKKNELTAHQSSKRGGTLRLNLDKAQGRVFISGQAVTVFHGHLCGSLGQEDKHE